MAAKAAVESAEEAIHGPDLSGRRRRFVMECDPRHFREMTRLSDRREGRRKHDFGRSSSPHTKPGRPLQSVDPPSGSSDG